MPWTLRQIEDPAPRKAWSSLQVGDVWFAEAFVEHGPEKLSPHYHRTWAGKRRPILVRLPGPYNFCVDLCAWSNGVPYGDGWVVEGELPLLTVRPSISIGGSYHGYLTAGVLSDDCDGRRYDERGHLRSL